MSENRQIARAAGQVGFFTLISRIGGLLRDSVMGYYFGTGIAADAFFVAFRIPNLLRRFVAEGAMSIALIPVFTDYVTNRSRAESDEAMSVTATLMVVVVGALTVLGMLFAAPLTRLFAPGFVDEPGKLELTIALTRVVFPYIFLVSVVAVLSGILNSLRHFAAPAMSPIFLNVAMILAAIASPWFGEPALTLAYGVVLGGIVQVALQMPPILKRGIRLRPVWNPKHEAVGRALWLMAPTVFGAAVYQINILVSTILASLLPAGSVSYLWYADRVNEFPLGVFAVALGTAALPSLAAQASRGAFDEMWQSLSFSIRLNTFINIPALVGIYALAVPITNVLFVRGAFGVEQALLTARALQMEALGLWSVSMVRLLAPTFYALGNTRVPVISAAFAFVANIVFSLALMGPVAADDTTAGLLVSHATQFLGLADLRHAGLALATSIAATVNLGVLLIILRRKLPAVRLGETLPSALRSLAAALAMLPALHWIAAGIDWGHSGFGLRVTVLFAAVAAGAAIYMVVAYLLGSDELRSLGAVLQRRRKAVS